MTTAFVRASNPIWYFPDLEGLPLNDQYYAFFLTNVFPYVPQAVFHDPAGTIPWNNPIEFYPNGTLPDNLYFNDSEVYRIEIRHGNTQADPLIYEINDFVPGGGGVSPTPGVSAGFGENQATMSQFSEVLFSSPLTISTAGTYHVAAGWDLILTGTGTATVTQVPIQGNQDFLNNPTFALGLNLSSWSSAALVQRFNHNGAIWSSTLLSGIPTQDGYISMSITAQALGSNYSPISFIYKPSTGTQQNIGLPGTINTGSYQVYNQTQLLIPSDNSDTSDVAYVDMIIQLLATGNILISNVQIVGEEVPAGTTPAPVSPPYQQESNERQLDHTFHYYKDSILQQPKQTLLTGWTFGLNPWQFASTTPANVSTNRYITDQTILVQQAYVASGTGNNVSAGQGSASDENLCLKIASVTTTNKFAIIQYIDPKTIAPYWDLKLSSLVQLNVFSPTHITSVKFKMRLISRASLPSSISQTEPIASWSNVDGSDPNFSGGWTAIAPLNDPTYTIKPGVETTFAFNQFQLPSADVSGNSTLGIVLYTVNNMDQTATADQILINTVSLVHNDFAIEASTETWDESLRKCQYYYEKSYDNPVLPGTNSTLGTLGESMIVTQSTGVCYAGTWGFEYNTVKRAIPAATIYSYDGTVANVFAQTFKDGVASTSANKVIASFWTQNTISTKALTYIPNVTAGALVTSSAADNLSCQIIFQYTLDSRLGV